MNENLYKEIIEKTKKSFRAKTNEKNKPFNTIANFGLKKGGMATRIRDGEYTNFSIKVLDDVKPLLTDFRILKAVKMLAENNIQGIIQLFNIESEINQYGINLIYSILKKWLEKNEINVPQEYINFSFEIESEQINEWIFKTRSDPLSVKIEIIDIGNSKKGSKSVHSVVPEDWQGKIFNNAIELHKEMDKLDWRKNKPPVSYCCIYGMTIQQINSWKLSKDKQILNFNAIIGIKISLNCEITLFENESQYSNWLDNIDNNLNCLPCIGKNLEKYIIVCNLNEISNQNNSFINTLNVGLLVSRLQKSIRRGKKCCRLLYDTIINLSRVKPYNLPEQQFIKVSGNRQLFWRLFITIIEDVEPYLDDDEKEYFGLTELICFSLLAHNDANIQFNDFIINKILYTALLIQNNDIKGSNWNWRKGIINKNSDYKFEDNISDSFKLAIKFMPMMSGDLIMLKKSIDFIKNFKLKKLNKMILTNLLKYHNDIDFMECVLASNDMHCNPNILIQLQSSLSFIPFNENHTTYALSSFIWENSSKNNVRNINENEKITNEQEQENKNILLSLKHIQKDEPFKLNNYDILNEIKLKQTHQNYQNDKLSKLESRIGFLLIFGKKIRLSCEGKLKAIDIIVSGTIDEPCKIKKGEIYLQDKDRYEGELRYIKHIQNNNVFIILPKAPNGCNWKIKSKKVKLGVILLESNNKTLKNKIKFLVNDIELEPFDCSPILNKMNKCKEIEVPEIIKPIIKQSLYFKDNYDYNEWELNKLLREFHNIRLKNGNHLPYNWKKYSNITCNVWRCILEKIFNNFDNEIQIGPVDRKGNKLHESINYLYEGTLLRIFNFLSFVYPTVIKCKTNFKFIIDKNVPQFNNLLEILELLALPEENKIMKTLPIIKTKLWNHQEITSKQIFDDIVKLGKKGFGDASNIGTGKTLTALNLMVYLCKYNFDNNITSNSGFLILLPTTKLYKTWKDEITKHTQDFDIIEQNANGSLSKKDIHNNSIIITTLGRMRDHPLCNSWIFVIIDECLSVQNKDAFQTQEACKQILCSQFGVLMMSATFFRSRFDKLFYMIKMLKSGLPEEKEFLDTILSECIKCNVPKNNKREWQTNINKFKLDINLRKKYDELLNQKISSEQLYIKLNKFLFDNFNYIYCFEQIIKKIELDNKRALIFTRSIKEADDIANKINSVTRYPNKQGKHVVLSYVEGTYGLNDLINYNTIISRPPDSDKVCQMKGRLDRPGNKNIQLYMEYFIIENTIEEASLLRIELCNNFYKNHIMPLADFYDLALRKIKINNSNKKLNKILEKNNVIIIDDVISNKSTDNKLNIIKKNSLIYNPFNSIKYNEDLTQIKEISKSFKKN